MVRVFLTFSAFVVCLMQYSSFAEETTTELPLEESSGDGNEKRFYLGSHYPVPGGYHHPNPHFHGGPPKYNPHYQPKPHFVPNPHFHPPTPMPHQPVIYPGHHHHSHYEKPKPQYHQQPKPEYSKPKDHYNNEYYQPSKPTYPSVGKPSENYYQPPSGSNNNWDGGKNNNQNGGNNNWNGGNDDNQNGGSDNWNNGNDNIQNNGNGGNDDNQNGGNDNWGGNDDNQNGGNDNWGGNDDNQNGGNDNWGGGDDGEGPQAVQFPPNDETNTKSTTESTEPFQMSTNPCERQCSKSRDYRPVCGSNGMTYTNMRYLECAQECGKRITLAYNGKCRPRKAPTPTGMLISPGRIDSGES